ncbi:MAG TPA: HAD family hydrolase [Terriglobales bacterium]|nr:HAD family hydrolase [Terriglobales bacterium]
MMAPAEITTLFFDWDGTLVDSAMSSYLTFQKALQQCGIEFTWEHFDAHFTPDWHRMYEAVGLEKDRWLIADKAWKESYPCVEYCLVNGARDTLLALRSRGYRVGVVTSGSRWRLVNEIRDFGLDGVFDVVICNDDVRERKPHPEGLFKAAAQLECKPSCCSYVGDVPEDVQAGKNAGMHTVGVKSGFPTSRRLPESGPDLHLQEIAELLQHF